ncbi:hypothetical protein IKE99_02170 [Candidatus Saccharibacteria bacterium]|nr:hypothetical protein [Candidatus Saccharibacteria bacterium]MBR3319549.1 hypothetical protein [Candidatus Saccharibacteria bacterium]
MAKKEGVALAKRIKISKSQRVMLGAVACASLILGVCLVFSVYFLKYIAFNSKVISEKNKAIDGYSKAIEKIGICRAPSGKIYTVSELESCNPDDEDLSRLGADTLRYQVIMELSKNENLESVARKGLSICFDSSTNQKVSVEDLIEKYRVQTNDKEREAYLERIAMCSALRVIPDALPSAANPLAVGASLNKIFTMSSYIPEGITPKEVGVSSMEGIGSIGINLQVESSADNTMRVLNNLEKSIREYNIKTAKIERSGDSLKLEAMAEAYYTEASSLDEVLEEVKGNGKVVKNKSGGNE